MLGAVGGPDGIGPAPVSLDSTNLAAILSSGIAATAAALGLYRPDVCVERRRAFANVTVTGIAAFPVVLVVLGSFHLNVTGHALAWLSALLTIWLGCILVTHLAFAELMQRNPLARKVLVVGSGIQANRVAETMLRCHGAFFDPITAAPDKDRLSSGALREQRVWGVVVAGATGEATPELLDGKLRGLRIFDERTFCERHLGRIDLDSVDENWLLFADGFVSGHLGDTVKRGLDIASSLCLLVLTLPLMLITAALIKLDSPGPVFYRQSRVGFDGKPFTLLKFRSMALDAEAGGKPRWAQVRDPRITRVGSFIRPMRIDELPQLLNVLRGEMSMIGPRPERPHFVEQLARVIPFYHHRAYVKPGLTGWAQVNYPYGASVEDAREKLAYDLYYVKNRNLLLDLLILVSTIRVILFREGAR
ncbi:MAG: exopolysaccharide biosynthesis polyprenyl glycosylphosphotransferase [Acetobacteraceae bacterium]|nr:exopolysaccharide biosynthesis polyprenyl glycosylphosphotransferase [Acetobacteraceae bacterium]